MAWTAADINRISQGTNSRKKQWTAEAVQKASKGTNNAQQATQPAAAEKTLYETAFDEYRANNNLGLAEEADRQSDWLQGGPSQALRASSPEGRAIGRTGLALLDEQSPTGRESAGSAVRPGSRVEALSAAAKYGVPMSTNVLEQVGSGAAAYGDGLAQKLKASYAPYSQKDEFDRLNEWFDTDDNRNLADAVRRVDNTHGAYTDADLIRNGGWTQAQIDEARQKNAAYDALPVWQRAIRRPANIIGGTADSMAGSAVMAGETVVQSAKNIAATQQNWAKVQQEIKGDARAEKLFQLLTDVDMDYKPVYPESRNRDLVQMGYGSEEIRNMRDRLAGLEVNDSVDPETSVGYQLHKRGQDLTGAAQSGLTDGSRAVQGAVSSAAENLAVAAVNPAAVLPVLSLQGAGDAMSQSMEKGESAGKTLAGGALKFGAGWAINSVGAADLAKTMGPDYAKDTVAGQIADWVRGMAGNSEFAKQYPAIANAVTGGMDNAMQAFVETYADKAIDAAMGDPEAAQSMFTTDTLIAALESGLSGGASGAMGGAVGTALARYNDGDASWRGQAEYYDQLDRYEKAVAAEKERQQRVEEPTLSDASRQLSQGESHWQDGEAVRNEQSQMERGQAGSAAEERVKEQPVVSDNPAVQQYAQMVQEDTLTGKTIKLFTPESGNEANRAAFEEAYGIRLPDTAAATRRVLRRVAEQKTASTAANAERNAADAVSLAAQQAESEAVEKAGETLETPSVTFGDSFLGEGALEERARENAGAATEGSGQMRETYGLREPSDQTARQSEVQRQLEQWGVESGKTKAAQDISQKLPDNVDADRYAAAASTIYHLAKMEDVKTFEDALKLAGAMDNTAMNVNYVLDSGEAGKAALNTAYLYGADAKEQAGGYGGGLTKGSTGGEGRVYYDGTIDHDGTDMGSRIIELNAAATGTDAVLKNVLQNNPNVRAYVDSETAQIFFGDNASDIFGTVLHEDYHWYNALDQEGARSLQDHALTYLAQMDGYESVDEMIRDKMGIYASQKLTYEQAAEELVADAWRGIFATEADFKRWVEFQRGQAEKNAGVRGSIHKVMNRVKNLLSDIISRAKEVLTIDPSNAAARKAKRLAEAQRRTLQDEYFAHAEKAMDTLRAAKENAAALKTESAAEGRNIRFSIQKDADGESYIKIDEDILNGVPQEDWKTVVKQAIKERYPNGFERNGWTIENTKESRKEFVWSKYTKALQWESSEMYADKMRMASNLDEIIQTADEVYREPANHKNAEAFNRGKIKVMVGPNTYEADVVTAIKPENREIFYDIVNIEPTKIKLSGGTHMESEDSGSSLPESFMEAPGGTVTETKNSDASRLPEASRESSLTTVLKTEQGDEAPKLLSKNSIAQENAGSKGNSEPVKKSVRFQLDETFEKNVDAIDLDATWSKRIRVGTTSEVLKSIGVKDQNIYWDSGKIRKILKKHSAENFRAGVDNSIMTKEIIKQVPQVLENPIVVLHSDTSRDANYASRIYMFGEVYDQTGKPVDVSLELLPTSYQGVELDNIMVTSAYGKKNVQGLLNRDDILYIDPNKNRTDTWLAVNRLQLPLRITKYGSIASLRYEGRNVKTETTENSVRFQMAEQADRDAKRNRQRQASRAIADNSAAIQTLVEMMGLTRGVRVSDDSILGVAERLVKASGAKGKADTERVAREMRTLIEYMKTEGADMNKAQGLAETIAGEILDSATYRNTELWQQYPEYHELSYTVDKNGKAKAELVRQYGSWGEAVAEARKHGVKLRQEEGHRDGNPAEEYEAIVNDTRSMGGTKQGAAELFRGAAKAAGVDGAASMESTEWLDVLMNVHDAIKPRMMSRFADVAEYEDAKVELAGRMIGDLLHVNEMNDAQAIFDSFQKWQRRAAAAAAGDETSAAKAVKDLRAVQKEQTREFNRRLAENQKAGNQSEAVQQMQEQQRRNAKAEAMLDANLDALGVDITNSGDMAEKLDVLKEAYEREWRAEKKRLKEERQQMLDEITLENKTLKAENRDLARQVANEQRRADRAEYSQIVQEREIMEWEAENQRKADAWQQKQAQKNAIAMELAIKQRDEEIAVAKEKMRKRQELASLKDQQERAEWYQEHSERFAIEREALRQQRDEDIAVAKALAEKRVQKARDGRKADELKRSIRNNAAQLKQMLLRPSKGKYVQPRLIQQAAEVAKLADQTILNDAAVRKLTALANTISQTKGTATDPSSIAYDWEQTGVPKLIQDLQADLMNAKQEKLDLLQQQLDEAVALGYGEEAEKMRDRLKARIRETENRTYLPLTVDQLRMLKAITAGTLHVIRTENKTLSLAKTEEIDAFAQKAGQEVLAAKGNEAGRLRDLATKYNLDMLGGVRVFRMLGGYTKNSKMEQLATMLNDGQRRQTEITVEGTKLFDNVTGKANLKQMERFAGPGAELVDIGLTDVKGKAVPLTHGQLCSLYMHLQNADSREHLLNGGLTLPDATLYNKGDIERAYQKGQTVKIGMLTGADGMPMADTILNTVENALTDYDRKWIEDMKGFFGDYTTNLINETSMKLVGFQRATVKNYYPIAVDKTQLASEIEGVKMDATIEGRGFLKERVKSTKPILLEECSSVVQRSLRDTAAYAGLAAPIRDANRILNANVETEDGIQKLKSGVLKEHWGRDAVNYVDYLLTDLQTKQRKRSDGIGRVMGKLRGNYAGAILTLNPGVAIAQAASLPTAGAVLGSDTMAAVLPFVKNLSGKQLAALKAEIREHGDALLQYRLRGSQRGELASIGVSGSFVEKAMDKLPKSVTGWINKMDEITVAALWEGAKHYVEHHAEEFNLSVGSADSSPDKGSPWQAGGALLDEEGTMGRKAPGSATEGSVIKDEAYWKAVNQMYQKVIEETQPNYTVMQRAGIQRSDNEITKTLTMFTTQRFQNYGILADAVMDYNAQKARYKAEKSAENKTEVQRAGQSLRRAAASQVMQTAVFALMKIGADFLLHRWDREQDENGDMTAESLWNRFAGLFTESAAGNFLFGSEIYSMVDNAVNGTDYDVVSATNISAVNDLFAATTKLYTLIRKDTTGMDEEELEAYHRKLRKAGVDVMEYGLDIAGIPAANGRKMVEAFAAYADDVQGLANGEGFSLNGTPASATGQYDRLFNAIERGDAEEAAAALGKLDQMGKSDKVSSELKKRLKNYDPDIETAAEARNAGDDKARQKATKDCIRNLYETLGIREGVKEDAARREAIIDLVTSAVDQKADALLAGDKDRNVYDDLTDALETGRAKDVQSEVDRLLTAGKKADAIQTKITGVVKSEYLAGNSHDREKLAAMLLRLEADGKPLYEEKDFESWVKQDKKKQEAAAGAVDEWAEVR